MLSKHKILRNGTAEKFIPRLSASCKRELEGSFKITKDEDLRAKTEQDASTIELSEKDELLKKIYDGTDEEVQKLTAMLTEAVADRDGEEPVPAVEELVRQVFAAMVLF